jgi:hypothetical protein
MPGRAQKALFRASVPSCPGRAASPNANSTGKAGHALFRAMGALVPSHVRHLHARAPRKGECPATVALAVDLCTLKIGCGNPVDVERWRSISIYIA